MKLFTYTDAIASRQYTMTTQVSDETMTINGWTPKDYEGSSAGYGFCEMEYCLGNSLNLPAVRTEYALGVLPIANLAVDAGVSLLQGANFPDSTTYSFTLGTKPISPLDLADGAATIADLGVHHAPAPVVKITDAASGALAWTYNAAANAQRVVPENVAYIMDETLSKATYRLAAFGTLPEAQPARSPGQRQDRHQWVGIQQLRQLDGRLDPDHPHRGLGGRPPGRERRKRAHTRCHQRCDRGGADLAGVHGGSHRRHPGDLVPDALRRVPGGRLLVSPRHRSRQLDGRRRPDLRPGLRREPTASNTPFSQPYHTPSPTAVPTDTRRRARGLSRGLLEPVRTRLRPRHARRAVAEDRPHPVKIGDVRQGLIEADGAVVLRAESGDPDGDAASDLEGTTSASETLSLNDHQYCSERRRRPGR